MNSDTLRRTLWQIAGVLLAVHTIGTVATALMGFGSFSHPKFVEFVHLPTMYGGVSISIAFSAVMTVLCFYMGRRRDDETPFAESAPEWNRLQPLILSMLGVYLLATNVPELMKNLTVAITMMGMNKSIGDSRRMMLYNFLQTMQPLIGIVIGGWLFFGARGVARFQSWAFTPKETSEDGG